MLKKQFTDGFGQWLLWMGVTAMVLLVMSTTVEAGWIFDVEGVFAPTVKSELSTSFTGEIEFLGDTTNEGELRLELSAEPDLIRTVPFQMTSNTTGGIGMRGFGGEWEGELVDMRWLDWDDVAAWDFDAAGLTGGGEWDSMSLSFSDYTLGSVVDLTNARQVPPVSEPGALALLAIGAVISFGALRPRG